MLRRRIIAVLTALIMSSCAWPVAAAPASGDLVKLPDDGNPTTASDSAVYYVGDDGKRYAFPNAGAYFTWYADFSTVKIVSAAELAALPLAGNITYRPGTRLVKITTDPKVYAVEPGGLLRPIDSEAIASALYGSDWNRRIDDLPDAFFFSYRIGDAMTAAVYPTGSIVRRDADGTYFRIEERQKRRITSPEVLTALRVQDKFVLRTSANLNDYPDANPIATVEPGITDTAQRNLVAVSSVPTFSVVQPSSSYVAVGGEAILLDLNLSSVRPVEVRRLVMLLEATTGVPVLGETDIDEGGLVYENNAQLNLRSLRLVDAAGLTPFGQKELALDVSQDQSQRLIWQGNWRLPAGGSARLALRAQFNRLVPNNEGYRVTLLAADTQVADFVSGELVTFVPATNLVGPTLTTLNAALEVSRATKPGSIEYVRGAKDAAISGLNFKATTTAPNVIKSLVLQGYIDEESDGTFLAGTDADNGTETRVRDVLPIVNLFDGQGIKVGGPVTVDLDGRVKFSGLNYAIPAGQTATLIVRGDISATVELENKPNRLTFDMTDASTDVSVVDDRGNMVNALGKLPQGGNEPLYYATIKKNGSVKLRWQGGGGNAVAGREVVLGTWSAEVEDDDYMLRTVSFRQVSGLAASMLSARLEYPKTDGSIGSVTQDFLGGNVTFSGLNVPLARDKTTSLKLSAQVMSKAAGAVGGEQIKVQFGAADALEFVSQSDARLFSAADLVVGSDFSVLVNTSSSYVVRYTGLTATKDTTSPSSVYRDGQVETLIFNLSAEPEGPVRVRKLTFKLVPTDAGIAGPANDSLELWARSNGDFADDDGVANLKLWTADGRQTIGEDSSTSIKYCVVHGSRNCSPVATGYESASGDFAVLTYDFSEGNELTVAAGTTQKFSFELDTSKFNAAVAYHLYVNVLGLTDLQWTDVSYGTYTALSGGDAVGFPVSSGDITVVK